MTFFLTKLQRRRCSVMRLPNLSVLIIGLSAAFFARSGRCRADDQILPPSTEKIEAFNLLMHSGPPNCPTSVSYVEKDKDGKLRAWRFTARPGYFSLGPLAVIYPPLAKE